MIISAPLSGTAQKIGQVADPTFAEQMLGPSIALNPTEETSLTVVSPVTGTLSVYKPHAFIVTPADGPAVLVHLGIDTVNQPNLFSSPPDKTPVVGETVQVGQPITVWDIQATRRLGLSCDVPVVVLDAPRGTQINLLKPVGNAVKPAEPLAQVSAP